MLFFQVLLRRYDIFYLSGEVKNISDAGKSVRLTSGMHGAAEIYKNKDTYMCTHTNAHAYALRARVCLIYM